MQKTFFYLNTNIVTKKWTGGKTRETIFRETQYSATKKVGKKSSEKSARYVFLYSHEYSDQKMGGKTRETIFPEAHE